MVESWAPTSAPPAALALPASRSVSLPLFVGLLNDAKLSSAMLRDISYSPGNTVGKNPI